MQGDLQCKRGFQSCSLPLSIRLHCYYTYPHFSFQTLLPSLLPCFLLSFPCFPFTLVCAAPHSPHISLPESPSLSVSLSLSCETSLYPSPLSISGSNTLLLSHSCLSLHICLSKHLPSHCLCISSHVWIKLFFFYNVVSLFFIWPDFHFFIYI